LSNNRQNAIQEAAYYIWLNRGSPKGQDAEIWHEAEQLVYSSGGTTSGAVAFDFFDRKQVDMTADESYFANSPYAKYRLDEIKRKIRYVPMDIMLIGATGAGKSSTLNALLGGEFAKIGHGVDPETKEIKDYMLNEYIRLWDTPGLGDNPVDDAVYVQKSIKLLKRRYSGGNDLSGGYLIDMAVVLVDGSSKDIGTVYTILNGFLFDSIEASRVLVVVNQADMAMKGRHWNNEPDDVLNKFLEEQALSLQKRIHETTGHRIKKPLFYSAKNSFNLYSLMDYIVDSFKWEQRNWAGGKKKSDP